jgi:glucose/arabinose dehydrogenase
MKLDGRCSNLKVFGKDGGLQTIFCKFGHLKNSVQTTKLILMKNLSVLFLLVLFTNCSTTDAQPELKDVFPDFTFHHITELISPPDNSQRMFVVLQEGIVEVIETKQNPTPKQTFLNIKTKLVSGGERGLLGLAFHPDFSENGYFYVYYTRDISGLESVVARYQLSTENPKIANPGSELILMTFSQPFSNHNGGKIAFGQDGYLYIGVGDGGSGGDPQNNAQRRVNLLGKMLRIDVNNTQTELNYAIPADNPYKDNTQGFREEIYAHGLRNPWKFAFDQTTGKLWLADVGQNATEEINWIEKGKNYGWRVMEANNCYNPENNCNQTDLVLPIWQYSQSNGDRSITGGYVYRGSLVPELQGKYIYADYQYSV